MYHLNKNNKLQHLNLEGNEITAVGANHLRRLIATDHPTLTSIELSCNPLKDKGVLVILSLLHDSNNGTHWIEGCTYDIVILSHNQCFIGQD